MYSVYQHWDPLKVCVVGRSYPPEFYSWIEISHVRELFERIAIETEEDYQKIILKLQSFGVEILRPELPKKTFINGQYSSPPMTPRDTAIMIGNVFYENLSSDFPKFYSDVKDPIWPECNSLDQFYNLPTHIQQECIEVHGLEIGTNYSYKHIYDQIRAQGNQVKSRVDTMINGAMVSRIGKDLYFGTMDYDQNLDNFKSIVAKEFTQTRNHIVNTGGHGDGTYCPVCPGLIVSLQDISSYRDTFPDWEVVYLPGQSWHKVSPFLHLKQKNHGRWWIPGFERDDDVINIVEQWLKHWTGYVEETVFDVNMLIIDPKNVMVFNYNKQVFDAFDRYGITPHIVPFRHRYFWDGGIHCVTLDLDREGEMKDYFPGRS